MSDYGKLIVRTGAEIAGAGLQSEFVGVEEIYDRLEGALDRWRRDKSEEPARPGDQELEYQLRTILAELS